MEKEINAEGPGKLLGYRAMNQKPRTEYSIHVPHRHMTLTQRAFAARQVNKKIKMNKEPFTSSEGPLWVVSLNARS